MISMLLAAQLSTQTPIDIRALIFPELHSNEISTDGLTASNVFVNAFNEPKLTYTSNRMSGQYAVQDEVLVGFAAQEHTLRFMENDTYASITGTSIEPVISVVSPNYTSTLSPSLTEARFYLGHNRWEISGGIRSQSQSLSAEMKNGDYRLTAQNITINSQQLLLGAHLNELSFQGAFTINSALSDAPFYLNLQWQPEKANIELTYQQFQASSQIDWQLNQEANGVSSAIVTGTEWRFAAKHKGWRLAALQRELNAELFNSLVVNDAILGSIGKGQYLLFLEGGAQLNSTTITPPPLIFNRFSGEISLTLSDLTGIQGQSKYYEPLLLAGLPKLTDQQHYQVQALQLGLIDLLISYSNHQLSAALNLQQALLLKPFDRSVNQESSQSGGNNSGNKESTEKKAELWPGVSLEATLSYRF